MTQQQFTLLLRYVYSYPVRYAETPIEKIPYGWRKRFADSSDREFELYSYNQHPLQHYAYKVNNDYVQRLTEDAAVRQSGQETLEDQVIRQFTENLAQEKEQTEGRVSNERIEEMMTDLLRRYVTARDGTGQGRDLNGEFQDFLEVRRPFMNPTQDAATN